MTAFGASLGGQGDGVRRGVLDLCRGLRQQLDQPVQSLRATGVEVEAGEDRGHVEPRAGAARYPLRDLLVSCLELLPVSK